MNVQTILNLLEITAHGQVWVKLITFLLLF